MTHLQLRLTLSDAAGNVLSSRKVGGPENRVKILYNSLNNLVSEAVSGSNREQAERDGKSGMGKTR